MVKIQHFQLLLILYLHKITIFGAKIQIIQVDLAFKNFPTSLLFSSKIQIDNFEIFGKLNTVGPRFSVSKDSKGFRGIQRDSKTFEGIHRDSKRFKSVSNMIQKVINRDSNVAQS